MFASVASTFLTISAFFVYKGMRETSSTFDILRFFLSFTFSSFIVATVNAVYISSMITIHRRFDVLNSILRFRWFLFQILNGILLVIFCVEIFHFFLSISNRKQVLRESRKHENSITTIKFVGRQHNFLTGIMDLLNICYSFQVWIYKSHNIVLLKCKCRWNLSKTDYDLHGYFVRLFGSNKFLILSIYSSTKWVLQGIIICSFWTQPFLQHIWNVGYLLWQSNKPWGNKYP